MFIYFILFHLIFMITLLLAATILWYVLYNDNRESKYVMCVVHLQRPLCTKSDEVKLAEEASRRYGSPAPTIFSKVIDKSIPADIIYEDEKVNNRDTTIPPKKLVLSLLTWSLEIVEHRLVNKVQINTLCAEVWSPQGKLNI